MKRVSSSTKENGVRTSLSKLSTRKRPLEHHICAFTHTQAFFPQSNSPSMGPQNHPFYQTQGSSNLPSWTRPESKQAYRKLPSRPETSKGVRPMERISRNWQNETICHSQYLPEREMEESKEEDSSQIEIIVSRGGKKGEKRKGKSKF